MPDQPSLLAQKLRDHRARQGRHGRMTQEELAEALGVSVDAVGKYERSVSYLRGDLEHRLVERLGWSLETVRACREDWAIRQRRAPNGGYRLLDDAAVEELFDGSWHAAASAQIAFAAAELPTLPAELEARPDVFVPIFEACPDHWGIVLSGARVVAVWIVLFLLPEDVARFRAGTFLESDLSPERLHRPILPGQYFGYCPALIVGRGHEAASSLLLTSFVAFLERLADRGVVLSGIGTTSVTAGGAQVCRDLGMTRIGDHCLDPGFGVWELPGAAIAGSVFGRRSAVLRRRYGAEFPA